MREFMESLKFGNKVFSTLPLNFEHVHLTKVGKMKESENVEREKVRINNQIN